eukprot:58206_1
MSFGVFFGNIIYHGNSDSFDGFLVCEQYTMDGNMLAILDIGSLDVVRSVVDVRHKLTVKMLATDGNLWMCGLSTYDSALYLCFVSAILARRAAICGRVAVVIQDSISAMDSTVVNTTDPDIMKGKCWMQVLVLS